MDINAILGTIIAICGFFGISFVIEKIPIKFSPLTMMKNFLTKDLTEKIGELTIKVEENENARQKSRTNEIKFELSNYEKLASNGIELSEDDIAFVRDLHEEYHNDLKQNHRGTIMYENIERMYAEQMLKKKDLQNKNK